MGRRLLTADYMKFIRRIWRAAPPAPLRHWAWNRLGLFIATGGIAFISTYWHNNLAKALRAGCVNVDAMRMPNV